MAANRKANFLYMVRQNRTLLLMLAPAVVFFVLFSYIPMAGIVLAFEQFNLRDRFFSPFIGLENFRFLFITGDIFQVARNTMLYNVAFILFNNALEILCAIILVELGSKWFKKITQSLIFLPYFISWVIVGAFAYNLFNYDNGLVNSLLKSFSMEQADIYNNPSIWPFIIVLFNAWKAVGYGTVIYLAAIMGIDAEMYEAAEIDGADILQKIKHITLPCLIPTVIILVLLSIGNIFRGDFNMFHQLVGNNSMLLPTTDVIDTFVTRSLLVSSDIGMAASAGLLQSIIGFATVMIVNQTVKRYEKDYSLF